MPKKVYTDEEKAAVLEKLLAPKAKPILTLARELHISEPTLYAWRKEALEKKAAAKASGQPPPAVVPEYTNELIKARKMIQALEAELERKNRALAELSLLVLQNQGLISK